MRTLTLVVVGLFAFQEGSDSSRWIRELDDEEVARRDEAQRKLVRAGEIVLPAIQKALASGVHAGNPAARRVLEDLERTVRERAHDTRERPQALKLISFKCAEMSLGDALAALEEQTKYRIVLNGDPGRRIKIKGKELPYLQVLDSLERQAGVTINRREKEWGTFEVMDGGIDRRTTIHLPGGSYKIRRFPRVEEGKRVGWILQTTRVDYGGTELHAVEILDPDGKSLEFDSCRWCSPHRVFVRTETGKALRIRIRGEVIWQSGYELRVDRPGAPQDFRVGDITIHYEFMKVRMTSPAPVEHDMLGEATIFARLKEGGTTCLGGSRSWCGSACRRHPAWCDDLEGVVLGDGYFRNRSFTTELTVNGNGDRKLVPGDVESVEILYSKRFREPFTAEAVVPAE